MNAHTHKYEKKQIVFDSCTFPIIIVWSKADLELVILEQAVGGLNFNRNNLNEDTARSAMNIKMNKKANKDIAVIFLQSRNNRRKDNHNRDGADSKRRH